MLVAFQNAPPGSETFNLRLIELVVVSCHQIGAYLFELDDGAHKHEVHDGWFAMALEEERTGKNRRAYRPQKAAFFHRFYEDSDQYPRGVADIAGYWAEGRIFGGVVVFDRGETEQEVSLGVTFWLYLLLFLFLFFTTTYIYTLSPCSATLCGFTVSFPKAHERYTPPLQLSSTIW